MKDHVIEFSRYTIASALALAADVLLLSAMTELFHIHYLASATAGFCIGATIAYLLSVKWAFSHRSIEDQRHEFAIFVIIGIIGLGINDMLMWSLTDFAGLHYLQSKFFSTGSVFLFNYTARKKLLFTPRIDSIQG